MPAVTGPAFGDTARSTRLNQLMTLIPSGAISRVPGPSYASVIYEVTGVDLSQFSDTDLVDRCDRGVCHFGGSVDRMGDRAHVTVWVD